MDTGSVGILVLLDLTAAFDSISHTVLLKRLEMEFKITGVALSWLKSYLLDRHEQVVIQDIKSMPRNLKYGVPQGSVLGPQLFSLYTAPLGKVIREHGMNYHFYADDTQLYMFAKPTEIPSAVLTIQNCIESVHHWMTKTFLKLNGSKTELLLVGSKQPLAKVPIPDIEINDVSYTINNCPQSGCCF
jgi:retron-type reverse transcriptase